jgi:hypothetical protein
MGSSEGENWRDRKTYSASVVIVLVSVVRDFQYRTVMVQKLFSILKQSMMIFQLKVSKVVKNRKRRGEKREGEGA